jgi:hypothetical protein
MSEPERIGAIIPRVLQSIEARILVHQIVHLFGSAKIVTDKGEQPIKLHALSGCPRCS